MADPTKIYNHLPDAYDENPTRDLYKLLSALARGVEKGDDSIEDFEKDIVTVTSDGDGLVVMGENLSVSRPPGLPDAQYSILIRTKAPIPRATIDAIKRVFEAATGLSGVSVTDKQTNGSIPSYEIWITLSLANAGSLGRGAYAGLPTNYDRRPRKSAIWGGRGANAVMDEIGYQGGLNNDHWWSSVDRWTQALVDSVKLAGTIIIYKIT